MPPVVDKLSPNPMTYALHVAKWQGGCGSGLCERASRVYARGRIPCDVLFVGEAPGESEDTCCVPFVGPAGKLLDRIVSDALGSRLNVLRICYTNLVCCMPTAIDGPKSGQPLPEEIQSCAPRLVEFIALCRPKLIVCVGTLARDYLDLKTHGNVWRVAVHDSSLVEAIAELRKVPQVDINHPAFLLRQNVATQGLLIQRAMITVRNAVEEYFK
jgi:uracil-DNA glycosylase family 4